MRQCAQCGAVSPDKARFCQRCGSSFQGNMGPLQRSSSLRSAHTLAPDAAQSRKKQRSFLAGLLGLLGIRYNPEKGAWGCAFVPAAISVIVVAVVVVGVITGPIMKLYPPFAPSSTSSESINVTFSGAISGPMTGGTIDYCEWDSSQSHEYAVSVTGHISGPVYNFHFGISPGYYSGPGTYHNNGYLFLFEPSHHNQWFPQAGSITVNSDERSGTLSGLLSFSDLPTSSKANDGPVQFTGSWNCNFKRPYVPSSGS